MTENHLASSKQNHLNHQWKTRGFLYSVCLTLFVLYAFTLQTNINGSSHDYLLDTGEIQVALNVWGTVHYTGYPHYTILSASLTQLFRGLGLAPALAASGSSMVWSLLGIVCVFFIFKKIIKENLLLVSFACITLGLIETIWLHSIIAEVYSFSFLLVALQVLLAFRLIENGEDRDWWLFVFVMGIAVSHHRILVFGLPALAIMLSPYWWDRLIRAPGRFLLFSAFVFFIPFLAYIYLPLRLWQGSEWVYGQPGTWGGFWTQFTGNEVTGGLIRLPRSIEDLRFNFEYLEAQLTRQLPWIGIFIGLVGLSLLARKRPLIGIAFLVEVVAYLSFVFLFPRAVWIPAVVMPVFVWTLLGIAYLIDWLTKQRHFSLKIAGLLPLILLSAYLFQNNRPFIDELVQNTSGQQLIATLEQVPSEPANRPIVAIPWGKDFFAATYGDQVTGSLSHLQLIDHRADFVDLIESKGEILTPISFQNFWAPDWWLNKVGPSYFNLETAEIVSIAKENRFQDVTLDDDFALGNGIRIRSASAEVQEDLIDLTVYWEAVQPIDQPYSVAVHLVSQFPLQAPADLLAQADSTHPVAGWSPTTSWELNQVTQDKYQLEIPAGASPSAIAVTMYFVNELGEFVNQEWLVISLENE